ncbi:GntR family transcriptional regulator [Amphibacillus marinus]|uniref:GntR family transcriptional regulator n=1 Tax=Amphibacillus marinus TaxID=872970 RepID=A0A1H8IZA6_9BACI|nr:GntR family transcriptional regulator [Amphibacillus marinus]SEN73058.1 GntR family transcriptional regulator [Amphibacillus marinus]
MSKVPKYIQVENFIIDEIKQGNLKVGDKIETEDQLVDRFGFSKMTINKALSKLVDKKYITRVSGKGSFVEPRHITKSLKEFTSFSDDMKSIGLTPGSKLLSYRLIHGNEVPEIAEKLGLPPDTFLHYFIRLRTGNKKPIAISYNYISTKVLSALNIEALDHSLYDYLTSLDFKIIGSDLEMEAVLPTAEQQEILEIDLGALLKSKVLTTVAIDQQEKKLGYFETFYNGELYTYRFGR